MSATGTVTAPSATAGDRPPPRRGNSATRLARFALVSFKPQVYLTYALLWVLALESSAAVLDQGSWRPGVHTGVRVLTVLLVLLYLRMADEQKDLEYDRVHHPDRPLVTGAVSATELRVGMGLVAVLVLLLNWTPNAPAAALGVLALDLAYAVALMLLERVSRPVRDGLFLNLVVTYPVQLMLSGYVLLSSGYEVGARAVPLLAVFVCVFLHFEFARKTAWRSPRGSHFYSGVIGPVPSALAAGGFALAAAALELFLLPGGPLLWVLVPLTLLLPALGARQFALRRDGAWPVPLAMAFVVTSYLALTLVAAFS